MDDQSGAAGEAASARELRNQLSGAVLFETKRLRCRKWVVADLEAIYAVYADKVGSRWVGDGEPIRRDECEQWLRVTATNYQTRGYGMFALEGKASKKVLGFCGLVHPGGQAEAEVKYAFLRPYWGRGLASEAIPALLHYGAEAHGLTKIIATVAPENAASRRVLQKAGMDLVPGGEGGEDSDTLYYEWQGACDTDK